MPIYFWYLPGITLNVSLNSLCLCLHANAGVNVFLCKSKYAFIRREEFSYNNNTEGGGGRGGGGKNHMRKE